MYTELLIGLSLVAIGALGIKEALAFDVQAEAQSLSAAKAPKVRIRAGDTGWGMAHR
jgi:nucleoid-associated protein YgaU